MSSIDNLLLKLKIDFPNIKFVPGEDFHWSPNSNTITYTTHHSVAEHGTWALLHELAHATLGHVQYGNDFDLIKIESATWQKAKMLGKKYHVTISPSHIQDCLDTYRDWLHNRAKCPQCEIVSMQRSDGLYKCYNCGTLWSVSKSPAKRSNKKIINKLK